MFEFEVTNYIPIDHFKKDIKIDSCMKPVIIFQGDVFETDFQYERMRKFFLDFFRLHDVEDVNISDLRRVIVISAADVDDKEIKIRSYQVEGPIVSKEHATIGTGSGLEFTEVGPSLNLKVRRIHLGTEELYKLSLKQPKQVTLKPKKNIEEDSFGTRGRVHPLRQNLNAMALRKYKKILGKKRFESRDKKEGEGEKSEKSEKVGAEKSEKSEKNDKSGAARGEKKIGGGTKKTVKDHKNSGRVAGGKTKPKKKFGGKRKDMDEF